MLAHNKFPLEESMKRVVMMLLVLMIAAAMAMAGGKAQDGGTAAAGGAAKRIEYWNDKPNPEVDTVTAQRIQEVSSITVEYIGYTDVASYQSAIQQSIRQSNAPGMFTWWSGFQLESLAKEGLLADLSDLWRDYLVPQGVNPDVAESLRIDGKIYAVPHNVLNNTMVYNKKVFQEAGITKIPETFQEFLDACAKIKAKGIYPIGGHDASWGSFIWFQILVGSYDPQLYIHLCNGTEKYTGDRMRAVMAIWKDMLDKGYFAAPNQEWTRAFAAGEFAMCNMPTDAPTGVARDYGMVPGTDYDAFVFPPMGNHKGVIYFEVAPIAVPAASAMRDTAIEVLQHYYETPVQQWLSDQNGMVLTSKVNVANAVVGRMFALGNDTSKYQSILRFYENTPAELRDVVITEMSRFIAGEGSIDQVLATCQQKADAIFK
jgi:multiple sugar transport system substrate-binding protein